MAQSLTSWINWSNKRSLILATKPTLSRSLARISTNFTRKCCEKEFMKVPTDLFIDGQYRKPGEGRHTPLVNPATEETFAEVAAADAKELHAAAQSAHTAWEKQWRDITPGKRAEVLFNI